MNESSKKDRSKSNVIRFPVPRKAAPLTLDERPTFKGFHLAAVSGDPRASLLISQLLGIPLDAGAGCAAFYSQKFKEDQGHVLRTMLLRTEIKTGLVNTVLILLRECFGLEGRNAVMAYNTLKAKSLLEAE